MHMHIGEDNFLFVYEGKIIHEMSWRLLAK